MIDVVLAQLQVRDRSGEGCVSNNGICPGWMKLRRRTSARSSLSSRATRSINRSIVTTASGRPAPRTGVVWILLVNTETTSSLKFGMTYGPGTVVAVIHGSTMPQGT